MYVTFRLKTPYDLDLLALKESPGMKSIGAICKESLRAFVRGTPYKIMVPDDIYFEEASQFYATSFYLDSTKDADAISFLTSLQTGYRNSALKQIIRSYMSKPFILPYYSSFAVDKTVGEKKPERPVTTTRQETSHASRKKKHEEARKEPAPQAAEPSPIPDLAKAPSVSTEQAVSAGVPENSGGAEEGFDLFEFVDNM